KKGFRAITGAASGRRREKREESGEWGFMLRHGALNSAAQLLVLLGASNNALYRVTINEITSLCSKLEVAGGKESWAEGPRVEESVRDPVVAKTKGAPCSRSVGGKKRKCTRCQKTGHIKTRCTEGNVCAEGKGVGDKESVGAKVEPFLGTQQSRTIDIKSAMKGIQIGVVLQLLKALQKRLIGKRVTTEPDSTIGLR
ncbi:hypothetical protein PIB30_090924, partial [Stylosanthes scabra]|nr:hypothetical protein [Stylosanthes scabra]